MGTQEYPNSMWCTRTRNISQFFNRSILQWGVKVMLLLFFKGYVVLLGFYVSPTSKVIRTGPWFKVSSETLEKPGIELTTPGLEGE